MSIENEEPLIDFAALQKTYESRRGDVLAIEDITFNVTDGEFVAIVGPSGCGKSTLLKIAAGLVPYDGGTVRVEGREIREPAPSLSMVFQNPALFRWKSVLENVMAPVRLMKLDGAAGVRKAHALLERSGLAGFEHHYPDELSGGMQQRVSICRALVYDPDVILMDEPFGALDALTRDMLNFEIQRIWQEEQKTVLFVTHSISEAVFLADRVVVLSNRPARVAEIVPIDLPRPRTLEMKSDKPFGEYSLHIYRLIGSDMG